MVDRDIMIEMLVTDKSEKEVEEVSKKTILKNWAIVQSNLFPSIHNIDYKTTEL